jgi:hypothetical protein
VQQSEAPLQAVFFFDVLVFAVHGRNLIVG